MIRAIGLTGGIGSGKSSVARMLGALGVPVLDLDGVGRACLESAHLQKKLLNAFGSEILNAGGTITRPLLAQHAFSTPEKTQLLNQIMHPEIQRREALWLHEQDAPYAIVEASVLIESGGVDRMDAVVVVLAAMEKRRERVLQRGDQSEALFEMIVARQCSDVQRKNAANFMLQNDGSMEQLHQQVIDLHRRLLDDSC